MQNLLVKIRYIKYTEGDFMRENIRGKLLRLFYISFIGLFIFIVWTAIFNSINLFYSMNSMVNIILAIFLVIMLYGTYRVLSKLDNLKLKKVTTISFLILIGLQVIFIIFFLVNPSWDFGIITLNAKKLALDNETLPVYFYNSYPNNIPITLLLSVIFKLVGLITKNENILMLVGYLINLILINSAICLLYKFIQETIGEVIATLTIVFCIFITPLYTYSQVIYTDTFSMISPIAMFYLFYKYTTNNTKNRYIYLFGVSFLGGIGSTIKANIIIAFIAILIFIIFNDIKERKLIVCTILLIPFIFIMGMNKLIISEVIPIPYNEAGLPATHWIMMGLKGNGGYNEQDVIYTRSVKINSGKEAAKKANIREIKHRLYNYGLVGYSKFIIGKISFTWGDGSYYAPAILSEQPIRHNELQDYVIGDKNEGFIYLSQVSHIIILVFILISGIFAFNRREIINSIHICLFGLILFLILWETRSRYLICLLPIMIYSAMYGMEKLFKLIDKKRCALKIE